MRSGSRILLLGALVSAGCARRQPPVILITVDSLRADHLGAYGSRLGATPTLDFLCSESQRFSAAFAPASMTVPALSSLMTSSYPEELGVQDGWSALGDQAPTLAAWLAGNGYRTAAVVSNFAIRRASGLDRGFERYDDTLRTDAARGAPERNARQTTRVALRMVDQLAADGRPFFLWVHYQDPHGPYLPPEQLRRRFLSRVAEAPDSGRRLKAARDQSGDGVIPGYQYLAGHHDPAFYRAGYAGAVAYVDDWIGKLITGLAERQLFERSYVIVLADHGESLGEDDYWFSHGDRITRPLVQVPLLVRGPGLKPGRRDDTASLLDVFPSLAGLLRLAPPAGLRGRDLFAAGAPRGESTVYIMVPRSSAAPEYGLAAHGYRYVLWPHPGAPQERLFRHDDDSQDVNQAHPEVVRAMRDELARARSSLRRASASPRKLSPEDAAAMRALGYVDAR